jgi:hypothetical protein
MSPGLWPANFLSYVCSLFFILYLVHDDAMVLMDLFVKSSDDVDG